MSESSSAPTAGNTTASAMQPRGRSPEARPAAAAEAPPPLPWVALSKADCVLWAIALHRAAVAARLSGAGEK